MNITRPILRYHGGKWRLAPWVMSFFPAHRVYVEPFAGAASILLRKPRSYGEVYNDLEGEVVNLFRVLRDENKALQLKSAVELTAFARDEFVETYQEGAFDEVERARRLVARAFMGFGSASMTRTHVTGFRANSNRSGTTPAHDWVNWPTQIPQFIERLRGVVIENKEASIVMRQHDTAETLFYVDPPYPWSTRSSPRGAFQPHCYKHEMTDDGHRILAETLKSLAGMVVLSGYACQLYDQELFAGWERHEKAAHADGARKRTEIIWLNAAASAALARSRARIFDVPQEACA